MFSGHSVVVYSDAQYCVLQYCIGRYGWCSTIQILSVLGWIVLFYRAPESLPPSRAKDGCAVDRCSTVPRDLISELNNTSESLSSDLLCGPYQVPQWPEEAFPDGFISRSTSYWKRWNARSIKVRGKSGGRDGIPVWPRYIIYRFSWLRHLAGDPDKSIELRKIF